MAAHPTAAVSLKDLQSELDALQTLCPVLLPPPVPQGYHDEDLWGIVQTEGKEQQEQFRKQLRTAVKQRAAEASSQQGCIVCGAAGQATASHEASDDEASTLRFTTLPSVSFVDRTINLTHCGFACGHCRALQDAGRFLLFLGTTDAQIAAGQQSRQHEEWRQLAASLSLHLAATNRAPDQVQASPEGCAAWCKEVASRAYALQVLASAVPGWKVVGPAGIPVAQATPGLACKLLKAMLAPKKKQSSTPSTQVVAALKQPSRTGEAGSQLSRKLKKRGAEEVLGEQPQAQKQRHMQHGRKLGGNGAAVAHAGSGKETWVKSKGQQKEEAAVQPSKKQRGPMAEKASPQLREAPGQQKAKQKAVRVSAGTRSRVK